MVLIIRSLYEYKIREEERSFVTEFYKNVIQFGVFWPYLTTIRILLPVEDAVCF